MRKVAIFALIFAFVCGAAFAEAPALEGHPNAAVYDLKSVGRPRDNARFINLTTTERLDFNVWVYSEKTGKWEDFGVGNLLHVGDTDMVDSKLHLKKFKYIAFEPVQGGEFKYRFTIQTHDLQIHVEDK